MLCCLVFVLEGCPLTRSCVVVFAHIWFLMPLALLGVAALVGCNTVCGACDTGKYQELSAAIEYQCKFCVAGRRFNTKSTDCVDCSGETYQNENDAPSVVCKTCQAGQEFTGTTTACSSCDTGKFLNSNGGACEFCPAGFGFDLKQCHEYLAASHGV